MKLNYFQKTFLVSIMYTITLLSAAQISLLHRKSIAPSTDLNTSNSKRIETYNSDITSSASAWNGQIGGFILPSVGTVNTLIIFSQFPDDNFETNNVQWPKKIKLIDT